MKTSARRRRTITLMAALGTLAALAGCKDKTSAPATSRAEPKPIEGPTAVSDGAVVAHGSHIYWIAGTAGSPGDLVQRFDVKTKTWSRVASVLQSRIKLAAATRGDTLVAIGGMRGVGKHTDIVETFEIAKKQWTRTGALSKRLDAPAAALHGDSIYVFGGNVILDPSMQSYDAESVALAHAITADGKVSTIAPMPTAREEAAAVTVGDKIYVLGGAISRSGEDSLPSATAAVEIYDPKADSWSEGPAMPRRGRGFAVHHAGEIVFFGNSALDPSEPLILDVASGEWRQGKARDRDVVGGVVAGAVLVADEIHVVSKILHGIGKPSETHIFKYAPKTDTWTSVY